MFKGVSGIGKKVKIRISRNCSRSKSRYWPGNHSKWILPRMWFVLVYIYTYYGLQYVYRRIRSTMKHLHHIYNSLSALTILCGVHLQILHSHHDHIWPTITIFALPSIYSYYHTYTCTTTSTFVVHSHHICTTTQQNQPDFKSLPYTLIAYATPHFTPLNPYRTCNTLSHLLQLQHHHHTCHTNPHTHNTLPCTLTTYNDPTLHSYYTCNILTTLATPFITPYYT